MAQKTKGSGSLKMTYFNIRGRGEFARLILAVAGEKYEDKRIEFAEWAAVKPETPLGFLPVLKVGDFEISQTMAIVRYLGRKFNMYGQDNVQATIIDMYLDTIADLTDERMKVFGVEGEDKQKEMIEEIKKTKYRPHFEKLEKLLKKYSSEKVGFAVGEKISIADLVLFHSIDLNDVEEKVTGEFPLMKKNRDKVKADPKLAKYLKERPASFI